MHGKCKQKNEHACQHGARVDRQHVARVGAAEVSTEYVWRDESAAQHRKPTYHDSRAEHSIARQNQYCNHDPRNRFRQDEARIWAMLRDPVQ